MCWAAPESGRESDTDWDQDSYYTALALVPGWPAHVCGTGPATGHPEAATRTTAAVARSVVGVYLHVVRGPWQLVKATCVRARLCCAPNSG